MKNTNYLLTLVIIIFTIATTKAQPNFDWAYSTGSTNSDYGALVKSDANDNSYTVAAIQGTTDLDPGIGTQNYTPSGGIDFYIRKLNTSGQMLWGHGIGGTGTDFPYDINIDQNSNVYVCGQFSNTVDFDPGSGVFNLTSNGSTDGFLLKLDAFGNFVWAISFGGTAADNVREIEFDSGGNIYLRGNFNSTVDFDPSIGVYNVTSAIPNDSYILKLLPSGNFIRVKTLSASSSSNQSNYVSINDMCVNPSGDIVVSGGFKNTYDFDLGAGVANLTSVGQIDIFIAVYDSAGNYSFAKSIGGPLNEQPKAIDTDTFGNIYVAGPFEGTLDFDPNAGISNYTSNGNEDGFLLKLSSIGSFIWNKTIGGIGIDYIETIEVDEYGNIYSAGRYEGNVDADPSSNSFILNGVIGNWDIFFQKLDSNGDFVWAGNFVGVATEFADRIHTNSFGSIYISGELYNSGDYDPGSGTYTLTTNGLADAFIVKLSQCVFTTSIINPSACTSYTSPSGNYTWTTSNTYTDTIQNAGGCDSVITINLTITGPSNGTDVVTACNSYTWIDNNTYTSSNSTATHTITGGAANGCDSIVTLNLTINNTANGTDVITACNSYTWIDNNTYTTSNNTATHTITNGAANGCDSIVTLNLTINNTVTGTDVITACDSYTWIDNNTYTTSNNTATHTIVNGAANGCDSIVTLNLTINNTATGTDVITACNSYTWIDNINYTASNNTATHTITGGAANGCDSIVTLNLTINTVDNSTSTQGNDSIMANATGATYQWLDCNNNYSIISGATNQLFVASANGSYAVEVTQNGCTDTSACVNVTGVGIDDRSIENTITIFPNPSNGLFTIKTLDHENQTINLLVINTLGKVIDEISFTNKAELNLTEQAKGIYYLQLSTDNHTFVKKIVIK